MHQILNKHNLCGAQTRSGTPCKSHPTSGKRRCRMHGGATGTGAPKGNANALKHGLYTASMKQKRKEVRALLKLAKQTIVEI